MEIPSSDLLAKNIKRLCKGLAKETARRCQERGGQPTDVACIEECAEEVLTDWFLGNYIPER